MKYYSIMYFLFILTSLSVPAQTSIEFSTGFPYQGFQSKPRDYFLTTQYFAGVSHNIIDFADVVVTGTFTQQSPVFVQRSGLPFLDEYHGFVPFTTDPFYNEYGLFSGIRFLTPQNVAQVFIKGQLGFTGTKYGRIERRMYHDPEALPGGPSYKEVEGSVMKVQFAALYGGGVIFHIMNSLSFVFDINAVNHFVNQPLDVYQSVGLRYGL